MNKTKIDQRIENDFNAFFDNEFSGDSTVLTFSGNQEIAQNFTATEVSQKADKYFGLFKKVFSFVPGVLFLHLAVPATVIFGFSIWGLFWFAVGIFMVWSGIGDLKNKKHFLLPLSVIFVALIFSVPFLISPFNSSDYYNYFYIGVLPLLFIAPILVKNYIKEN